MRNIVLITLDALRIYSCGSNEVYWWKMKMKTAVVRVVFEFYPGDGGGITHTIELSKKINPYLN